VSWKRVRGHEAQVKAFERAVRRNRLAHAYLFVGPAGIGKRLFAQELAKALLCEGDTGGRVEACDRCAACALVEAGTHPDCFTVSRPEEGHELPIGAMRELSRNLSLKPSRGHGKVAILDDADDLNDASANCFLKTLEEPPPRSVLILVGSSSERQLATIVSRCQVVRFAPLPEELVAEVLRGQEIEDAGVVARLARLSGGSPGQALALADPALWEFRRTLLEGLARPRPDSVALGQALQHFVEEAGKESSAQRRRAGLVLRLLIEFLDDVLRVRLGGAPRLAEQGDQPLVQALAKRGDPERLLEVLERCLEGDAQIDRRVQLVLVLEGLLDSLGQQLRC
jgi:DNA polymerase-3 subunit delta'